MSRALLVSVASLISLAVLGCGGDNGDDSASPDAATPDGAVVGSWSMGPSLPVPIANNAVGDVIVGGDCMLISALGIGGGFANTDITTAAYTWRVGDAAWQPAGDVPGPPRVAASAVGVAGNLYVLGGYTVAGNGAEASSDRLDMYDVALGQWQSRAAIPIPIDDTVALVWQDRYIVVVSGWSNTGNVDAVQIYDAVIDSWAVGTPFPGTPAFGHAGAIDGNSMIIIDGAASSPGFPLVAQAWRGELDPENPTVITWTDLGAHAGPKRYRAAGGTFADGLLWFHGGTETPYNFNGLRYDNNQPAEPLASTLVFGDGPSFELNVEKPTATMDHRSLASCGQDVAISVGGMVAGPAATGDVWSFVGAGDGQ